MGNANTIVDGLPIRQGLLVFISLLSFAHEPSTPLAATPLLSRSLSNSSRSSCAILRTVVALTPAISASFSALTLDLMMRMKRFFAFKGKRMLIRLVMGGAS